MKLKLSTLGISAGLLVAVVGTGSALAQSTNLIDVQFSAYYNGYVSTNQTGAAVIGTSGDVWNEVRPGSGANNPKFCIRGLKIG